MSYLANTEFIDILLSHLICEMQRFVTGSLHQRKLCARGPRARSQKQFFILSFVRILGKYDWFTDLSVNKLID